MLNVLVDPRKRATVQSDSQEDLETPTRRDDNSPQPTILNSLQKLATPPSPRHRAPTMTPSRSQDSHYGGGAMSPSRRHPSPTRHQGNGTIGPPALLMPPPPTTWLGWIRHRCYLCMHTLNMPTSPTFRFFLFVLKMAVLGRACWPSSLNMAVGGGLVLAAAVDLSYTLEMWLTGLLLLLHFTFVLALRKWAELCQVGHEVWEWHPSFDLNHGAQP